jgi:hypothetical protein
VFLNGRLLHAPLRQLDTFVIPQGLLLLPLQTSVCVHARMEKHLEG